MIQTNPNNDIEGKSYASENNIAKPIFPSGILLLIATGAAMYDALAVKLARMTVDSVPRSNA